MKVLNKSRKQRGVGLIEILIVLVVLVIAWAAIAALQGTLMSGSSITKARNEALELAREKTEELRATIEKGQYDLALTDTNGVLVDDPDGVITGVNATFTRSWSLDDVNMDGVGAAEDYVKKLTMRVEWENPYEALVDGEPKKETVILNSIITYYDKLAIASYATGGADDTIGTPTPNNDTASEGPGILDPDAPVMTDEIGDGDLGTDDSIYTGVDKDGNLVVYQGAAVNNEFLNGLTVYGGKINKTAGTIYYRDLTPFVQATSPSLCASFARSKEACGIDETSPTYDPLTKCAEYVCYTGGDCKNGGDGCLQNEAEREALPDLNGGWWGKIGDFFPTLDVANSFPTICMGDSTNVAARLYVTKRTFGVEVIDEETGEIVSTGIEREGINTSFECHDVMISYPNDADCSSMIEELTDYGIKIDPNTDPGGIEVHQVIRELASDEVNTALAAKDNSFENSDVDFCANRIPPPVETYYEYACTCNWNKKDSFVESVIGVRSDGLEQIGCCTIGTEESPGCNDFVPSPVPGNLTEILYSCSTDPAIDPWQ